MNVISDNPMTFREAPLTPSVRGTPGIATTPQQLIGPPGYSATPGVGTQPQPPAPPAAPTSGSPLIPAGFLPTSQGYALPPPRGLPVQLQALAGGTNILTGSARIPFPFAVTAITFFAPAATPGAASDGKIGVGTAEQGDLTISGTGNLINLINVFGGSGFVYCPVAVSFSGLWLPVPTGHEFLYAQGISQGGATNILVVVTMTIVPLGDYLGS